MYSEWKVSQQVYIRLVATEHEASCNHAACTPPEDIGAPVDDVNGGTPEPIRVGEEVTVPLACLVVEHQAWRHGSVAPYVVEDVSHLVLPLAFPKNPNSRYNTAAVTRYQVPPRCPSPKHRPNEAHQGRLRWK